jgi:hypothetical protein
MYILQYFVHGVAMKFSDFFLRDLNGAMLLDRSKDMSVRVS